MKKIFYKCTPNDEFHGIIDEVVKEHHIQRFFEGMVKLAELKGAIVETVYPDSNLGARMNITANDIPEKLVKKFHKEYAYNLKNAEQIEETSAINNIVHAVKDLDRVIDISLAKAEGKPKTELMKWALKMYKADGKAHDISFESNGAKDIYNKLNVDKSLQQRDEGFFTAHPEQRLTRADIATRIERLNFTDNDRKSIFSEKVGEFEKQIMWHIADGLKYNGFIDHIGSRIEIDYLDILKINKQEFSRRAFDFIPLSGNILLYNSPERKATTEELILPINAIVSPGKKILFISHEEMIGKGRGGLNNP